MVDELARIERIYGSVAEYQRCMYEEEYEDYEPTDEEIIESEIELASFNKQCQLLDGDPSEFIKELVAEWEMKAPKESDFSEYNQYIYAGYDFSTERCLGIVEEVEQYYQVKAREDWDSFYGTPVGTFAIEVEYRKHSQIFSKRFGCLDYATFKDIFRDLEYAHLRPTMCYVESEDDKHIRSNMTLGHLRIHELKHLGFENEDDLQEELESLGFDEEEIRKQITENFYR